MLKNFITFYKPTSPTYFERQINDVLARGGQIINPLNTSGIEANNSNASGGGKEPYTIMSSPNDLAHPIDPALEEE